jgi:hypothetical protein
MPSKKASQPPKPGTSPDEWQEYALSFDGYEHAGSTEAAERIYLSARKQILAGKPITGTTDYLRTVLFAHQRRYRLMEPDAQEEAREQRVTDAILAALQPTA